MDSTQLAVLIAWSWVGISTFISLSLIFLPHSSEEEMRTTLSAGVWTLQAILGLLVIQALGVTA